MLRVSLPIPSAGPAYLVSCSGPRSLIVALTGRRDFGISRLCFRQELGSRLGRGSRSNQRVAWLSSGAALSLPDAPRSIVFLPGKLPDPKPTLTIAAYI